jgi:hypothetical protein
MELVMERDRSLAGLEGVLHGVDRSSGRPVSRAGALLLAVSAAAALAVSQWGLWRRVEPLATWSYDLSWWSTIALLDACVFLRTGASMLLSRPKAFLGLSLASAVFWLLYECANVRLADWYYAGIPPDPWTRSLGVIVSFATVLPGVLEIHAAIAPASDASFSIRSLPRPTRALRLAFAASGWAFLVLPLLFPRVAYPLIWGPAFLLLEPWLASRDDRSLLGRWLSGDRAPLVRMLLAGAISGILWESWNSRSPAKWIYTVPFFEDSKLFEMPWFGFVGFVPFALGCHSFARALVHAGILAEWDPLARAPAPFRPKRAAVASVVGVAFAALAIVAVNRWTIRSTRAFLAELPGIPRDAAERLERAGVTYPEDLLEAPAGSTGGFDPAALATWRETARLAALKQMGARGVEWLASRGVRTVADLATRDPDVLQRDLAATGSGPFPAPSRAEVHVWASAARSSR